MIRLIAILLLFPSFSYADGWDKTDTNLQIAYSLVHLVDWSQTIQISKDDSVCYEKERKTFNGNGTYVYHTRCTEVDHNYESNQILGKRPSRGKINKYFAGTLIGHFLIAKYLNKPYRNIWQSVWIGIELGYVNHNRKNGFKVSLNF